MAEQWDGRPQNPEWDGWPDAEEERLWALAPTHLRVLVDRRIAARVAAARREALEEAAKVAADAGKQWLMHSQRHPHQLAASQGATAIEAAIRALLEDGR